jgi:hypothetical protein
MATNRFQFSDDFVLKNGKVGINTAEPQEKLEVLGTIIADNIRATDISNLHTYEGFLNQNQNIDENLTLSSDTTTSLSGEIIVGDDATVTIGSEATSSQGNIDSLKVYNTFTVPTGGTEDRPRKVKPGQLYYNVDFKTIEFWDGNVWRQVDNTTRSGRGVFGGGNNISLIQYINISTTGNAINFGNLTTVRGAVAGCSSNIRGVTGGGDYLSNLNTIDYITIASEGNAIDFGDLSLNRGDHASCSSSTRGIWAGGYNPVAPRQSVNVIDYVEIATLGNALDFGDLSDKVYSISGCSSPTRGIFGGGGIYLEPSPATRTSTIRSITISSTGNSIKFGDLVAVRTGSASCSNSIRGLFAAGSSAPNININNIETVIISTFGNSVDFGSLSQGKSDSPTGVSNSTRGVFAGGVFSYPARVNSIEYISMTSGGNALDFGDLVANRGYMSGMSDSHGGLGGF